MAVSPEEPMRDSGTDHYPLLMEQRDGHVSVEHVIDIERGGEASSSDSPVCEFSHGASQNHGHRETIGTQVPSSVPMTSSPGRTNSRSSSFLGRNEAIGRRNWSPFNSGFWISIELVFTLAQIIASMTVLCLSRLENPHAPLFAWVVGYTTGCFASLPVFYWRFLHRNHGTEGVFQTSPASPLSNSPSGQNSYVNISLSPSEHGDHRGVPRSIFEGHSTGISNTWICLIMDHFKMTLDCFFAVWFVVGNVWIFGGHASAAEAPNLYRLCIVYLTLSCIGYAMPFILCAMICCCLPCIISILGIREDLNKVRGASEESISALPVYRFKAKKDEYGATGQNNLEEEGGIIAIGTEERVISGEDAVCVICLARYMDDDELRELPCSHFFHAECVDRWLKINATCPLCKYEIIERQETPTPTNSTEEA